MKLGMHREGMTHSCSLFHGRKYSHLVLPLALNKCASSWTLTSSLEHLIFTIQKCFQANDLHFGLTLLSSFFMELKFFLQNSKTVIRRVPR
jgi:hypothetical protein